MPASTRFLLGGYYVAMSGVFLTDLFDHRRLFDFSHWAQFLARVNPLALPLFCSVLVSLVAVIIPRNRILVLAASAINAFYAVGGAIFVVWVLSLPGFMGRFMPDDSIQLLGFVFVPGVAAGCFYHAYRGLRLTFV